MRRFTTEIRVLDFRSGIAIPSNNEPEIAALCCVYRIGDKINIIIWPLSVTIVNTCLHQQQFRLAHIIVPHM